MNSPIPTQHRTVVLKEVVTAVWGDPGREYDRTLVSRTQLTAAVKQTDLERNMGEVPLPTAPTQYASVWDPVRFPRRSLTPLIHREREAPISRHG